MKRAEQNYEIPFDNGKWKVERAKVEAGEKDLPPLDASGDWYAENDGWDEDLPDLTDDDG